MPPATNAVNGSTASPLPASPTLGAGTPYKFKVLDCFSGIGGFSLGLERTGGFETVAFCEIEDFPRKVLAKHWPDVPCYRDVWELTADRLAADGIAVDVITGGFPCQDLSIAGLKAGMAEGTRSGLWSEIIRLVREIRPSFLIVENVANLLRGPTERPGRWFGRVLGDLAECGYDAEWENIPARDVGLQHHRERVWVVAYPDEIGRRGFGQGPQFLDVLRRRPRGTPPPPLSGRADVERRLHALVADSVRTGLPGGSCGDAHGVSDRLDRLAALGNAVVPQIPELIGHAILQSLHNTGSQITESNGSPVSQVFHGQS